MPNDTTHIVAPRKRADGKWDLDISHVNGNLLWSSNQGYENRADCIEAYLKFMKAIASLTVETRF